MTNTFDYTEEDLNNPSGNNDLSSRAKFFQRSLYKEVIYPENVTKPLDSWYDKNLFGRVDKQQRCVIPRTGRLVNISAAASPSMYCLDFVNVAFGDLVAHMKDAFLTNCIDRRGNPVLFNMTAVMAYTNPSVKYQSYLDALIEAFTRSYTDSSTAPIKNFKDFKTVFMAYLRQMSKNYPITMPGLLLSGYASPMISGLKIAIDEQNAGDDFVKYNNFINDPNFLYYIQSAKKFGFLVDKNAPWVLTADLFSDAAMKYIGLYATPTGQYVSEDNFFQTYFYNIRSVAMGTFSTFVRDAYRQFANKRPLYEEEKVHFRRCSSPAGGTLEIEPSYRAYLASSDKLTDQEIIDLYTFLRNQETEAPPEVLSTARQKCYELYRTYGAAAMQQQIPIYLNNLYKGYLYPKNYHTTSQNMLDSDALPDILDTAAEVVASLTIR